LILSEDRCPQHLLPVYIGGIAGGMSDVQFDESILIKGMTMIYGYSNFVTEPI